MLSAAEFGQLLAAAGVAVDWRQAKAPHQTASIQAVTGSVDKRDEALVNAYGVGGRYFQFLATALPVPPEKFDRLTLAGVAYTIQDVVTKHQRATQNMREPGIIKREGTIHITNVLPICPECGEATRVGFSEVEGSLRTV